MSNFRENGFSLATHIISNSESGMMHVVLVCRKWGSKWAIKRHI